MTLPFRTYTLREQIAMSAQGFREMVDAEGRVEDEDGVCRQPMVWLRRTGQRALPARRTHPGPWPLEATHALGRAGFLFPIPRDSGLYLAPCCDMCWLPVDDLDADELFCCKEQPLDLWEIVRETPVIEAKENQP